VVGALFFVIIGVNSKKMRVSGLGKSEFHCMGGS
jgi:hypothetical protein